MSCSCSNACSPVATLLGASIVVFAVLEVLPGNAAQMLMGPDAAPEAVAAWPASWAWTSPPERYWQWMPACCTATWATATPTARRCRAGAGAPAVTVPLAVLAMLLTAVLALLAGVYAASHHNKAGDVGLMGLAQIGIAIPNFWFAILLILLFSVKLQWFSAGGFPGWEDGGAGRAAGAAAACRGAGRGAGRHPGAHHALGGAGGAARGLCAHRPRQGPAGAPRCGAMCCATP
jgi:peptide/nickel transport system permease protein